MNKNIYTKIKLFHVKVGTYNPVAEVRVKRFTLKGPLELVLHFQWNRNRLGVDRSDKKRLMDEWYMSDKEIRNLEKNIYWKYGETVRISLYGKLCSPYDYSKIFGRNLILLRKLYNYTINRAALEMSIDEDTLKSFECIQDDIKNDLIIYQDNSILYKAAKFYKIPSNEMISQSLFYHIPVPEIK